MPDHSTLDPANALENVRIAMTIAEEKLGVPQIVSPEDFVGEWPDEKSNMLYLSYFCGPGSPGDTALLFWIWEQIPEQEIENFTTNWVDGKALGALVNSLSNGAYQGYEEFDDTNHAKNCQYAMEAAEEHLGIEATLTYEEMADPELNPLVRTTYLTQFFYAGLRPKVLSVSVPDKCGRGQYIYLDVSCPDNITGSIEARANSTNVESIPVDIKNTAVNQYRVKFLVKQPESYTLYVNAGGIRVKGSPFSYDFTPADAQAVEKKSTILPKKAGIPAIVTFDTANAGKGELTARAYGETSGDVPYSVDRMSPNSYKVAFIPFQPDVYLLDVKFEGHPVKGSPFSIALDELIQPESVEVGEPQIEEPGAPVIIPIDLSKAGEAKLVGKCVGEKSGEIDTHVVQVDTEDDKPTGITFIPPIEDIYNVSIFYDNTEVTGSPVRVNLYPLPPDSKKVVMTEAPSGILNAGETIKVGFDTSKAGSAEFTATCAGKSFGDVPVEVRAVEKNKYEVLFVPPDMDVYALHVMWDNAPVIGSPFTLNLLPKDFPDATKVKVQHMTEKKSKSSLIIINDEIKVQVDTTDAGKGALEVTAEIDQPTPNEEHHKSQEQLNREGPGEAGAVAIDAHGGVVMEFDPEAGETAEGRQGTPSTIVMPEPSIPQIEPSPENPKIFIITYVPNSGGMHKLNITWSGQSLPKSPLTFNVITPRAVQYGAPIVVELKTIYKRKHLKVNAYSRKNGTQYKVKMDKITSGHYKLIFQPKEPGIYLMDVKARDKHIEGSPFIMDYVKELNPEAIKVSGLIQEGFVGEPIAFTIDATNAGFGDLSIARYPSQTSLLTVDQGDVQSIHLQKNDDGTYSAIFTPLKPGHSNLDVRFEGEPIPGSPFPVSVLRKATSAENVTGIGGAGTTEATLETGAAAKPSSSKKKAKKVANRVYGLKLDSEKFIVGTPHKFKLHCEDLGEGKLEVTSKPQSAAEIDVLTAEGENSYWVEILPKKSGKNDIIVRYAGNHIMGSPFHVVFSSRGDAAKCMLIDTLPECKQETDNEVVFCISTKGAGKGKIAASAKSISTKKHMQVSISHPFKHHYHVQFLPTDGFNYMLSVMYDEIHIKGSPFRISLGDASLCHTAGEGLVKAWSGKWNSFTLETEDAGPGDLKVSIEGEGLGERGENITIEPNISAVKEQQYEVAYQPMIPGRYWITVKWADTDIPGSPFEVPCTKPLQPSQFFIKEVVPITFHEKKAHYVVNCKGMIDESDKLSVSIHSTEDEKYLCEVAKIDDQSYLCHIAPPQLGVYQVYVLWDEKHIPGSPFQVQNVPSPGPPDFSIEASEAEGGTIAVKVVGPKYAFFHEELVATVQKADSSYQIETAVTKLSYEQCRIEFKPTIGGEYLLSVQYDEHHTQGSPFSLISTDASQCYTKGKGLLRAKVNDWNKFTVFTENAGPGELRVEIEGEGNANGDVSVNPLVTAASETRYDVSYFPSNPGKYKIFVFWDIHQIPGSPFKIMCCDPSRYSIAKPPKEESLGKPMKVGIKESTPAPKYETLEIYARSKQHIDYPGDVKMGSDGNYIGVVKPPELGKYVIHVQCNGFEIQGSPFKAKIMPPPIPEKVIVSGPGLRDGKAGEKGSFTVNIAEAGHGYVSYKVQGPKGGFNINLHRHPEDKDSIVAEYNPTYPGTYLISVMWSGVAVPHSPFKVKIGEPDPEILTLAEATQETG